MRNFRMLLASIFLLTTVLTASFLVGVTRSGQPYDPWVDLDDDGDIDIFDIVTLAGEYGMTGTPINKTALLLELQSRMDSLNASMLDLKAQMLALLLDLQTNVDSLNASVIDLQSQVNHLTQITGAVYRWNVFDTYVDGGGWVCGNEALLYGGVHPSDWTNAAATAQQMSSDKNVLRTLFCQKGYSGTNALVHSSVFSQYSAQNGRVAVCLFRIRNALDAQVFWAPYFRYTCYGGWGEYASVALNGVNVWTSAGGNSYGNGVVSVLLPIPANRTSTVIFVSTSSPSFEIISGTYVRSCTLAFTSNSLTLPTGLQYVDDLDTAIGGWEQ